MTHAGPGEENGGKRPGGRNGYSARTARQKNREETDMSKGNVIGSEGERHIKRIGKLKIHYYTRNLDENTNEIQVGKLHLRRTMETDTGILRMSVGPVRFPLPLSLYPPRYRHYRKRATMTEEEKENILADEAAPKLGYRPDLKNPKTFNEKILWSKFHIRDKNIIQCCDKYAVKEYVAKTIGEQYTLPVLAHWDDASKISFDGLPDKFVLKVNWGSGLNIFVTDKNSIDREKIIRQVGMWMQPWHNSYYATFNWAYQYVKPVAFVEPYIEQMNDQVFDYKFFFNHGKYVYMFIATDRLDDLRITYFDENFQFMPFTKAGRKYAEKLPEMPKHLDEMLKLGAELAKPFQFVRVDFYEVGDRIYVGEMTFYTGAGVLPFSPPEWDLKLGEKMDLKEQLS